MTADGPGHLFVVHADLRHLAVDAWLLPTDERASVTAAWSLGDDQLVGRIRHWQQQVRSTGRAVERVEVLPGEVPGQPVTVLTAIPIAGTSDPEYHAQSVRDAVQLLRDRRPDLFGPRLRLALPALGTGASGARDIRGDVLAGLMPRLREVAAQEGVDLVLVLRTADAAAAARDVRREGDDAVWWPTLDEAQRRASRQLADQAVQGRLTLFTGAGTSMSAGLPSWGQLITALEERAFDGHGGRPAGLGDLSLLDRASIVADRLGGGLDAALGEQLRGGGYGVQHALLANLPVTQAITLNYDRLLEDAARDTGRAFSVLPYEPAGARWLLKLHGDLDQDGAGRDVVLTRDQYLSAGSHRATLTGLVQAVMTTQRLLFVGFGLADDHVHALVHDVRTALGPEREHDLGTALVIREQPALQLLWGSGLRVLPLVDDDGERPGRATDVFLDHLANAADPSYLHVFDRSWRGVPTADERDLGEQLQVLAEAVRGRSGPSWEPLRAALRRYGWREDVNPSSPSRGSRDRGGFPTERPLVSFTVRGRPATFATAHEAAWKDAVRTAVTASGVEPAEGRFGVRIEFRTPPPRTANEAWDLDNLIKPTLDAMEGVFGLRAWRGVLQPADDRVDRFEALKRTATADEELGASIDVWLL